MPKRKAARVIAVIVHHHGYDMLDGCLESLLQSVGVELAIILVANGCDEELPPRVAATPSIHSIETPESRGFSAANNFGLAYARNNLPPADYYYFINNDTVSSPTALQTLTDTLSADPAAGIAGPKLLILGAQDHYNSLGINVTEDAWGWDEGIGIEVEAYGPPPKTRPVLAITGAALLIDSSLSEEVGNWTELYDYYFEDIDLALKVWKKGRTVVNVPEAVVFHQISATMTEGSERKHFFFWRNRLLLALVHWPPRLLLATFRRAIVDEILHTERKHNQLQRRALRSALGKTFAALRRRWRYRGNTDWRRFLHPPGSVPVITLPEAEEIDAYDWSSAARLENQKQRVLVLGWSPLPFENERMNYAPGVRSWQLASPLAAAGHTVCLVCARIPGSSLEPKPAIVESVQNGVLVYHLDRDLFDESEALEKLVEAFTPDVVVGAAPVPSRRAVEVCGELPVWVDLFGDPMAEAQAKASLHDRGDQLGAYCDLMIGVLARGDRFSAVSDRQRYAVIGQLGLVGRLNRHTSGTDLVKVIPCAEDQPLPARELENRRQDPVVLWSGGFNTWCDIDTLCEGLAIALDRNKAFRVVITGEQIEDHDQTTYPRFKELIADSSFRDRLTIHGAVSREQLAEIEASATVAVVTEKQIYERELGSSARVVGWMARGIPLICADISELSELISNRELGLTYPVGDAEALADCIVEAVTWTASERLRRIETTSRYCREELSSAQTTRSLLEWIENPSRAPDRSASSLIVADQKYRTALERANEFESRYHHSRSELGKIHQGRMWKLWMGYLDLRAFLLGPFVNRSSRTP